MRIKRIEEFLMTTPINEAIEHLLQESFPDYPLKQTYFKQVPNFRFLAWEETKLIGQAAIEFRVIRVGEALFRVFLIGDICVSSTHQHQKVASKIIKEVEKLSKEGSIDFIVVAVSNPALYLKSGFTIVDNDCRWVIIQKHTTLGVRERNINNSLMVKQLGTNSWNDGLIDFLGPIV